MKIEAAELNANGIKISKRLLEDAIKKYKARYYDMCYVLYDNYWQSTPSEFVLLMSSVLLCRNFRTCLSI